MGFVKSVKDFIKGILVEQDVSEIVVYEQMVEKKKVSNPSSSTKTGTVTKTEDASNDNKKSVNE